MASTPPAAAPAASEAPAAPAPGAASATPASSTATPVSDEKSPAAAGSTSPAATTESQPSTKRRVSEAVLGRKLTNDLEAQKPHPDDDDETRRKKKKQFALASCLSLTMLLGGLLLSLGTIMGLSALSAYTMPMLSCKMHGYDNHCMFNSWDKNDDDWAVKAKKLVHDIDNRLDDHYWQGWSSS